MIRSIAKVALPRRFVQLLRDLVRLEGGARATYLRRAWRRARGGGHERPDLVRPGRPVTLVAVCHGNILRSAYAGALLQQSSLAARLPDMRATSAGLHAIPGRPADPRGVEVARERGVNLTAHHAVLLDSDLVARADLLLVMDRLNEAELVSRHPEAEGKVALLGEFDPGRSSEPAIPDPYSGDLDAVRASYRRVEAAVAGLVTRLEGGGS